MIQLRVAEERLIIDKQINLFLSLLKSQFKWLSLQHKSFIQKILTIVEMIKIRDSSSFMK